jgi:small-conductance mechanosensitive channel/CRP-like cAMP-binding protein
LSILPSMDLSVVFCLAVVADVVILRMIPGRRRVARFVWMSLFFVIHTVLIVALVGSPLQPVYKPKDLPREFWLQVLASTWWALAARQLIAFLAMMTALGRKEREHKLLSDIVAGCIYICSALAMMGFVFGLSLQGLLATSGVIAIVLGLALQNTLGDVFSGISLSIEEAFRIGDNILLEGGAEGEVIEMTWRSTRLRNSANDIVIVPNSAMAKMRIQNHTAGARHYSGDLTVTLDSRNEPELSVEILKQAAMACSSILEHPEPFVVATELKAGQITYDIHFTTHSIASAGKARSQLIAQIYKRARPVVSQDTTRDSSAPLFLFEERQLLNHLPLLHPLSDAEKTDLSGKVIRRDFEVGEELLTQGKASESVHFVFSGVLQATRRVQDGRVLNVRRVGPGDSFGEISLLTGMPANETFTALTIGVLLELQAQHLKPILQSRPELVESLGHSAAKLQQLVAAFDRTASQSVATEQRDLLSRIRNFFHLEPS